MDSTSMQTSLVISTKHAAEEFGEPSPQHARIASSSESEDDSEIAVVGHARLEDDDDDAYLPSVQTAARVARARSASSSLKAFAVKQRMARGHRNMLRRQGSFFLLQDGRSRPQNGVPEGCVSRAGQSPGPDRRSNVSLRVLLSYPTLPL